MKTQAIHILLVGALCSATATASEEAYQRLLNARGLKCEFGPGTHGEWNNGDLAVSGGRFGSPDGNSTIHYDSIDVGTRKARVIGTVGSADLGVIVDGMGITLLESVFLGGMAVTTIYGSYDAHKAFPAVISKHIDFSGPLPQQYYGSCVVWE